MTEGGCQSFIWRRAHLQTYPYVELAVEAVAVLGVSLKVVAREEPVGGKCEAGVGRFGDVERRQDQLAASTRQSAPGPMPTQKRCCTLSLLASRHSSSLNLNMHVSASCSTAMPSSLRVKLRTVISSDCLYELGFWSQAVIIQSRRHEWLTIRSSS